MKSVLNTKPGKMGPGILLKVKADRGYGGNITLYEFNQITLEESGYFKIPFNSREYCGSVEPPGYTDKDIEPFNRRDGTAILFGFEELDVIKTSDNGRFLSLKKARKTANLSARITEIGYIFSLNELSELSKMLDKTLLDMGVPKKDTDGIIGDIYKKLDYDKQAAETKK